MDYIHNLAPKVLMILIFRGERPILKPILRNDRAGITAAVFFLPLNILKGKAYCRFRHYFAGECVVVAQQPGCNHSPQ